MKSLERPVALLVVATGVASVAVQLVTIREFLATFQGNEFVIALIIFCWLTWGGIGTLLARLVSRLGYSASTAALAHLSIVLAGLASVQILAIRLLRDVAFIPGMSVGFYPTLAYIALSLAPYALLVGFVLPYSLLVLRTQQGDYPGSTIYLLDNLGDVLGGALFAFVLVYLFTPLRAAALAGLPLVACALFLPLTRRRPRLLRWLLAGCVLSVMAAAVLIERQSLEPINGRLMHYTETRYGRIAVVGQKEQVTLFKDGVPVIGSQNVAIAEESVHYPLSQLAHVQNLLLVSSEGGMLAEIAKYRPRRADYVELDPAAAALQFGYGLLRKIPALEIIYHDGRAYLQTTSRSYDAIIVSLPEPDTFQINRFYTDEFFKLARQRLTPNGVLCFSMDGFDNYLATPQRRKLATLFQTVRKHFEHVRLLPGQRIYFICRQAPIETDIPAVLAAKGIETLYIKGYFYGNVTTERIDQLNALINQPALPNTDFNPRLMRIMFDQWFARHATSPLWFMAVMVVLLGGYLLRMSRAEYVLFSTGFMTMGCEILVIFAFQVLFGYIYFQIGLIVTVFLAGLLPGAWIGSRLAPHTRRVLAGGDVMLALVLAVFVLVLFQGGTRLPTLFFLLFGLLVSLLCGFQFPVALELEGGHSRAVTRTFSADLLGAAAGTLVTSVVMIPYLGILWTAAGLILLKLTSLLVLGWRYATDGP